MHSFNVSTSNSQWVSCANSSTSWLLSCLEFFLPILIGVRGGAGNFCSACALSLRGVCLRNCGSFHDPGAIW